MESKLMPCKVADLIDVIFSHNERVGIWVEYRNGDESGCALLWKGMAHELPRQHLNSRFVRIFGLIPETIIDADIINIIVEIPTPMNTSEPTTEIVADLRIYLLVANKEKPTQLISTIARAADRLESQEKEIAELKSDRSTIISSYAETSVNVGELIKTLTARAEQAERERDAAIAEFDVIAQDGLCEVCFFGDFSEVSKDTCMEDCCFQWRNKKRGFAQEGDGERCRVEF